MFLDGSLLCKRITEVAAIGGNSGVPSSSYYYVLYCVLRSMYAGRQEGFCTPPPGPH